MLSECKICGKEFEAKRRTTRSRLRRGSNQWTCSPVCAKVKRDMVVKSQTICVVCGGEKKSRYALTCSHVCKMKRKSETLTGKAHNLCNYTAPEQWDYDNMIDILNRKGYVKSENSKEKWTYFTEGFPFIQWVDRVARGVVVSRSPRSRKKQPGHEDGVQQQA